LEKDSELSNREQRHVRKAWRKRQKMHRMIEKIQKKTIPPKKSTPPSTSSESDQIPVHTHTHTHTLGEKGENEQKSLTIENVTHTGTHTHTVQ